MCPQPPYYLNVGAKGRCPPSHSSFALTRATGGAASSIFDHGYLLQRACLLTECDCGRPKIPSIVAQGLCAR